MDKTKSKVTKATKVIKKQPTVNPAEVKPITVDKPLSPIELVLAKYNEAGWQTIKSPKNNMNDLIAQKSHRLHFVQVVPKKFIDDPRYHGMAKSSFIQNAFSNGATPVFAHVDSAKKIVFEDVNLCGRVIVNGKATTSGKVTTSGKAEKNKKVIC